MARTPPSRMDPFGRTEADYIAEALSEAKRDIVAFGDIVSRGRAFELTDAELDQFVRNVLRSLISAGVKVVRPREAADGYVWEELTKYNTADVESSISALIEDSNGFDPDDRFFAWFSFDIPGTWPKVNPRAI
jgi:hypothetical protein